MGINLSYFCLSSATGRVFGSRAAVKFTPYNAPEPDLCYVSSARVHILREQYIVEDPDMVCEIISPGTRKIDRNDKMKMYARYGVQEYWLIDPHKQIAEFFRNDHGKWVPIGLDCNWGFSFRGDPPGLLVASGLAFCRGDARYFTYRNDHS